LVAVKVGVGLNGFIAFNESHALRRSEIRSSTGITIIYRLCI
jgi:hypothetical protein